METRGILSAPAVVTIVAVALAVVAYLTVRSRLVGRDFGVLVGARVVALLLLWFALLEPTRVFTREVRIPAQVALLLDRSQSMAIEDEAGADGPDSRWNAARAAMSAMSADLGDRFHVREYVFDAEARPPRPDATDAPDGHATDVGGAIATAIRDARGAPLSGVVVFSDGAQNVGAASAPSEYGAPVFTVGVGEQDAGADLIVSSLDVGETLLAGETARVKATVIVRGYAGRQFTVALTKGAELVDAAQVQAVGDEHVEELEFDITPDDAGPYRYAVEMSPLADELTASNNRVGRSVQVLPSRTRVLLAWGGPSHEFAFLRRALRRVPSVDLTISMPAMPDVRRDALSAPARAGRYPVDGPWADIPGDADYLDSFDVVVIGDLSVNMLSPEQVGWLEQFVETRGGGIVWCAGERWLGRRLGTRGVEALLPVDVPAAGARVLPGEFAPALTRQGRYHAVTQLAQTPSENDMLWRRMQLWSRQYSGLTAKPGSATLVGAAGQPGPLLVYHRAGAGKSMLIATDAMWRWALAEASGGSGARALLYERFWAQAVRWLATPPDTRQVRIELPAAEVDTGESAEITVRVFSAGYVPEPDAVVRVALTAPTGEAASVPVIAAPGDAGAYRAMLRFPREGEFQLEAQATARGVPLGRDTATLTVQTPSLEYQRPARNDALLEAIAQASGGRYVSVEDAASVVPLLRESDLTREVRERRALWNTPALLIAVAALLGSEWWLRKRRGLV
jgi:hypothetical protein